MTNNPTVTGEAGLRLIKEFEGLRLAKYLDAVGKWTIGSGHLILPNENYDQPISLDVANALLRADLKRTEEGVRNSVTVTINQNQFDALVSFAFNLGVGNLKSSTLLRLLNEGNIFAAADQFLRWNKAGGRELPGLTRRRRAERDLFIYML